MNKISRLTALLLALTMILSTFAAAETSYQVGQMTTEQWQQMVEQAENELYVIEPGDSGETVMPEIPDKPVQGEYYPYTDGVTVALADEDVNCQISASGVAILTNAAEGQWQMRIGDQWVNISGAVGDSLSVTGAMMNGMECVEVRKALTSQDKANGEVATFTATATIEIAEPAPTALFAVSRAETTDGDSTENAAETVPYSLQRANENTTYTVIINYKFQNGMTAAASWGASLGEGTNLDEIVANPNVVGYKPLASVVVSPADVGGVTYTPPTVATADDAATGIKAGDVTDPGSVNLAITGIDQHITVTVTYEPTLVDYTVIHKQQNTDNDNYTEVERVTERGLTGYIVPDKDIARSYPGFYSLLYEQPAIAANGSTVVEICYDRYYYLISFELFGGYGVDPVYGRFGAAVGDVGTPIRAGYTFKGWATTKEKAEAGTVDVTTLPATIPAEHTVYYAVWEVVKSTTVTIVYWGENANDEKYSYISSETVNAKPGASHSFNGTTGTLWCPLEENHQHTDACGLTCTTEAHTHSIEENCYTLTCDEVHVHTEECYSCTHKHDASCYTVSNNGTLEKRDSVKENELVSQGNGIYVTKKGKKEEYYVRINNAWYKAVRQSNGDKDATYVITYDCHHVCGDDCLDCNGHVHSGACYTLTCTKPIHIHDASCYDCGYVEHQHDNACKVQGPGLPSELWKFVKSDTVTVAADGSTVINVYYDRTPFTLTFKDGSSTVYTIQEKWGANISSHWPIKGTNGTTYDNGERWDPSGSNTYKAVLVYLEIMPDESFTLSLSKANYDEFRMHYMVEALPDTESTTEKPVVEYSYAGVTKRFINEFTVVANYNHVTKPEDFFDLEGFKQWTSKPTFGSGGSLDIDGGGDVYFYYTRNSYNITFNNGETDIKTESVAYEASLAGYADYTLTKAQRPSTKEEGSVEFAGWYLNPECSDDAKVDFTNKGDGTPWTMPASNMIVYAKWVPVTYKVRFFLTEDLMKTGQDEMAYTPTLAEGKRAIFESVPHGTQIDQEFVDAHLDYNAMTVNGGVFYPYTFVAWFYYDEANVKHPFEPATQIKQNLDVFAEWSSDVRIPYTIKYAVPKMENGVRVVDYYVAADTTGSALAGTSKTFEAKGGADLFEGYQTGCFPETESNTIKFEVAQAQTGVEYIFWYTPQVKVPYKVYYVTETQDDENPLTEVKIDNRTYYQLNEPKEVKDNENVVVTETFVTVPGYMPDAYQKRLIVSNDGNPNNDVIIFIYTKDEVHTYYRVTHYIENPDAVDGQMTWTEYTSSQFVGDIGITEQYNDTPLQIAGFEWKREEYTVGSTAPVEGSPDGTKLTADGMQINLYYTRKDYPYKVQYLLENSTTKLLDPKTGREKFEKTVVESAPTGEDYPALEQYELVTSSPQTLTIRIEEGEDPKLNVITFYYREKQATLYYEAVGPENAAADFGAVTPASEQISILSGIASGSTASAGNHYSFEGWYKDAECKQPVDASWVQNGKITPQKPGDVWPETTTYYAKFVENEATINYAVGTASAGMGSVSPENEKLKVLTGSASGSTATGNPHYSFEGWYTDVECTNRVDASWVNGSQIVPTKAATDAWVDGITYYAKFVEDEVTITYVAALRDDDVIRLENTTGGVVDLNDTTDNGVAKTVETIRVISGVAAGATAESNENYSFVGWFSDAACTQSIGGQESYAPAKENGVYSEATYYALFERKTADLVITKQVVCAADGTVPPASDAFVMKVTLPDGQYAVTSPSRQTYLTVENGAGNLTIQGGETITIKGIAVGSAYKVEEINVPDYYEASSLVEGTIQLQNNEVKIQNTYKTGKLTISKMVDGATAPADLAFTFDVTLSDRHAAYGIEGTSDTVAPTGFVTLKAGESVTITGIPWGTQYKVVERENTSFRPNPENRTVQGNVAEDSQAAFTNTYLLGDLRITKTVVHETDFTPQQKRFEVIVTLSPAEGAVLASAYDVTGAVVGEPAWSVSNGALTGVFTVEAELNSDAVFTIKGIPAGTTYAVSEAEATGFTASITATNDNAVLSAIDAGKVDEVTVTNTYLTGKLNVTKTVSNESGIVMPMAFEFTLTINDGAGLNIKHGDTTVTLDDQGQYVFTLEHGETAVFAGIPAGAAYEVVETDYTESFTTQFANASGEIKADQPQTAAFTNTCKVGDLQITKTVVNNTGKPLAVTEFEFTVTLKDRNGNLLTGDVTYAINGTETTKTLTNGVFTLKLDVGPLNGAQNSETASATATVLNLPNGTQYAVTETHVDDCLITFEGANGQIEATQVKTATFTNTFPAPSVSTLTVTKEGMQTGESAIVQVVVAGHTYMLALNNTKPSQTITGLPIGSTYTVKEINSWTWQYDNTSAVEGTIVQDGSTVVIKNKPQNSNWMHDESYLINDLGEGSSNGVNK